MLSGEEVARSATPLQSKHPYLSKVLAGERCFDYAMRSLRDLMAPLSMTNRHIGPNTKSAAGLFFPAA